VTHVDPFAPADSPLHPSNAVAKADPPWGLVLLSDHRDPGGEDMDQPMKTWAELEGRLPEYRDLLTHWGTQEERDAFARVEGTLPDLPRQQFEFLAPLGYLRWRQDILPRHRTTREVAEEVPVPVDVLEGRQRLVTNWYQEWWDASDLDEKPDLPSTVDMLGTTVTWTYDVTVDGEDPRGQWEIAQPQAANMRITKLDADGNPLPGAENTYVSDAVATVESRPRADLTHVPVQEDTPPAKRSRKRATPEQLEAARQEALARLDGDK
jgi:hypothetical protein